MSFFRKKFLKKIIFICASVAILMIVVASRPPETFPSGTFSVHIQRGDGVSLISKKLFEKGMIKSELLFKVGAVLVSGNKGVFAGDYRFTEPQSTFQIITRMVEGHQDQPKVSITIPEGTNVADMAFIYLKNLSDFNAPRFVSLAKKHEGYLYPDTYYFLANAKPEEVIEVMRENFDEKIKTLDNEIKKFNKPLADIITMASLVEKEAYADESRKIIAGILWKRLDTNMPLQVDAPFYYVTGKNGNFTFDDLKIDSPYNTYLYKGLPKGPISNPSLATIKDVITPVKTNYWFYLTGKDGEMRYSANFAQHVENKNKYLR